MDETTDAALDRAAARVRDRQVAEMVTLLVTLAAEYHPEEIRYALGKVFSTEGIEETTRRAMLTVTQCHAALSELRSLVWGLQQDCDRLRAELNGLEAKKSTNGKCPYCREKYVDLPKHLKRCIKNPKGAKHGT